MKKRKKCSRGPWVVEQEHLVNWVLNKMPVRYKWKTMYINPLLNENRKRRIILDEYNERGCVKRTHTVDVNEIDLLIA